MCGGRGSAPEPPKYTSSDGQVFDTALAAQEHDRMVRLARSMGYQGQFAPPAPATSASAPTPITGARGYTIGYKPSAPAAAQAPDPFQTWLGENQDRQNTWKEFYETGLTAGDYRAEMKRREEEARREAAVAEGRKLIETQFGQFNDGYYDNIRKSYLDYYQPQLDEQFQSALESLTYDLTRRNVLNSQAGQDRLSDLRKAYGTQLGGVTNKAEDAVRQARALVTQDRDQLFAYNDSAADANAVNERIGGITDRLTSWAPQMTPLGQVFFDFITPVANTISRGITAERMGYGGFNTGLFGGGYDTRNRGSYNEVG